MAEKKKNNNNTPARFGSSILVPCVQELAKQPIVAVPPRYLRPDDLHHFPIAASEIPVIDMSNLQTSKDSELDRLHSACENWGFFQLVNHGVSDSLIEKLKVETKKLFDLSMEEKKKLWQREGDVEGFGQAFVVSEEQKLDWSDLFFIATAPSHLTNPRLFQNLPLPFRQLVQLRSASSLATPTPPSSNDDLGNSGATPPSSNDGVSAQVATTKLASLEPCLR